ncbi:MAG: OB-fold nucleic acid binding domain-containing protein, partial [Pseudomonadota bacterium]
DDCRQLGLTVQPPNVNTSAYQFSVAGDALILYGLGAIKGVGRAVVEAVIAEREIGGPFRDLIEFCRRIDLERVNKRALEAMIKAGAFDVFGVSRRGLSQQLPEALQSAEQEARAREAGQNDMFGLAEPAVEAPVTGGDLPDVLEWSQAELLANEKEALGLYLTGHPFDAVRTDAKSLVDARLAELAAEPAPQTGTGERNYAVARREVTVAGLIVDIRKRGNRVTVVLDDDSGRLEVSLFSEAFTEHRHLLVKDEIVVVQGALRYDEFIGGWQVNAKQVFAIDRMIEERASSMILKLAPNGHGDQLIRELHDTLMPFRQGRCDVAVQYTGDSASARIQLGSDWNVRPSRELRDKLSELLGRNSVRLLYTPARR